MPRVVPSQIVALIDKTVPQANRQLQNEREGFWLDLSHLGAALALVEAIDKVPTELLQLDAETHNTFLASIASIRASIPLWQSGDRRHILQFVHGFTLNPVSLLRQVLSACPDEFPSPTTIELPFIGDRVLADSIRLDISAANQDLLQGEWKGATVLAGSAVEALLLWALQQRPEADIARARAAVVQDRRLTRDPGGDLERWHLPDYVEVAGELGTITPGTVGQARLAKDFRNLIHPGRAIRLGQKCDRGTALSALAAVELVVRDLTP